MMHSSPMPLSIALDLAKRLHHELSKHLSPEQRRDFSRMERLIVEAQAQHKAQLMRAKADATGEGDPSAEQHFRLRKA